MTPLEKDFKIMEKNILNLIYGLVIVVLFCSCPYDPENQFDGELIIKNNSNDTIIYAFYVSGPIENSKRNYWGYDYSKNTIPPNQYLIDEFNKDSPVLPIWYYLFNLDSIRTIPWERIRDERIILKEVIFNSLEDMEACDFTITYP